MAFVNWPMREAHKVVRACERALLNEGSRIEISKAMMATTTNSSISVKPTFGRCPMRFCLFIALPFLSGLLLRAYGHEDVPSFLLCPELDFPGRQVVTELNARHARLCLSRTRRVVEAYKQLYGLTVG